MFGQFRGSDEEFAELRVMVFFPTTWGAISSPGIFQITGWLKERNSFVNFGPPARQERPAAFVFRSRDQEISLRDRKQGVPKKNRKKHPTN